MRFHSGPTNAIRNRNPSQRTCRRSGRGRFHILRLPARVESLIFDDDLRPEPCRGQFSSRVQPISLWKRGAHLITAASRHFSFEAPSFAHVHGMPVSKASPIAPEQFLLAAIKCKFRQRTAPRRHARPLPFPKEVDDITCCHDRPPSISASP